MFSGGLSPLARGTPRATSATRINNRFIPAGAGNSTANQLPEPTSPVYPRWRGELMISSYPSICFSGLSPLARGTRDDSIAADESERFIPAGAGNSAGNITNKINVNGLSPLARGTHVTRHWTAETTRFIPAGAGNSSSSLPNPSVVTVYPRWRGELIVVILAAVMPPGLSPLARGTL